VSNSSPAFGSAATLRPLRLVQRTAVLFATSVVIDQIVLNTQKSVRDSTAQRTILLLICTVMQSRDHKTSAINTEALYVHDAGQGAFYEEDVRNVVLLQRNLSERVGVIFAQVSCR